MAQTLGTDAEGFPDGFGAGGFAGVVGKAQTGCARISVDGAERFGAGSSLVAAKADADDGGELGAEFDGLADDTFRFGHSEVADCVKDPENGEAQLAFGAVAGAFESGEDGFEACGIVIAPHVDDADGDVDLGVDYTLFSEVLAHGNKNPGVAKGERVRGAELRWLDVLEARSLGQRIVVLGAVDGAASGTSRVVGQGQR